MVIYGQRFYGKVDVIPGVGHVATRFYHVDYLPLIPNETWLITGTDGGRVVGVKIPLSAKSIFVGWARGLMLGVAICTTILATAEMLGDRADLRFALSLGVAAAISWFALLLLYTLGPINRASYSRACHLARLAEFSERRMAALAKAYGQAPPTFGFQPITGRPMTGQGSADDISLSTPTVDR